MLNEKAINNYAACKKLVSKAEARGIDTSITWSIRRFFESALPELGEEQSVELLSILVADAAAEALKIIEENGGEVKP